MIMMNNQEAPFPSQAQLTINLDALVSNWKFYQENGQGAQCAAVVKANAYGTGIERVTQKLAAAGCKTFFVAHAFEGQAVRNAIGAEPTIYVLNGLVAGDVEFFHQNALRPVLNQLGQIDHWREHGLSAPAAVHIDTGMNRLGIKEEQLEEANEALEGVDVRLIMSHLACASDPQHPKNLMQRDAFIAATTSLPPAPLSLAASAGALLEGDYCFDMIRPGIGLYGGGPFDADHVPLEPVVTLEASIIQLQSVGPGDTVGYGATWQADRRRKIATVAMGYADGFLRSGSNRGFAVIGGAVCPIVGRVSMDLITLDVTNAGPNVAVGSMAQFLGSAAPIDAQAQALDTIPYELLTNLGQRFFRTYLSSE